jgi:hypothetical protein
MKECHSIKVYVTHVLVFIIVKEIKLRKSISSQIGFDYPLMLNGKFRP